MSESKKEFEKLKNLENVFIQLIDNDGNHTKCMKIDEESIQELIVFLEQYFKGE
jgi:hypothetical protein